MKIFIIVLFIFGLLLFAGGLLESFSNRNGALLIAGSILLSSVIICVKLEEMRKSLR